jgi:hypothetical protein
MPYKSTHTLIHHFSSSPLLQKRKPQGHGQRQATQGGQRPKETHHSRVSFPLTCFLLSCVISCFTSSSFSFSLDLLPEEIIGTEETPEYISSDSSLEAEDATPEQKINHQLRRRVRHLEHDLRDITIRCQAERERRMALEALVGGKYLHLHLDSALAPGSLSLTTVPSVSDVSDRYSNLKAAWDSLVEAVNHGHPHSFQVAVTVVLEQVRREELKKQRKKD